MLGLGVLAASGMVGSGGGNDRITVSCEPAESVFANWPAAEHAVPVKGESARETGASQPASQQRESPPKHSERNRQFISGVSEVPCRDMYWPLNVPRIYVAKLPRSAARSFQDHA